MDFTNYIHGYLGVIKQNINEEEEETRIVILNFEDDTIRPVVNIDKKYTDIIKEWYVKCGIIFDIENTILFIDKNTKIPKTFQDISNKYKVELLDSYLPNLLKHMKYDKLITTFETKTNILKPVKNDIVKNDIFNQPQVNHMIQLNDLPLVSPFNNSSIIGQPIIDKNPKLLVSEILAYNDGYDSLHPAFGSNCYEYTNKIIKSTIGNNTIVVVVNTKFLKTFCIDNPTPDELYIIKKHTEYGFNKLYQTSSENSDIISFVRREFVLIDFNSEDDLNKKIKLTTDYVEYLKLNDTNTNLKQELNIVKDIVVHNYELNDDVDLIIKVSVLHDTIIDLLKFTINAPELDLIKTNLPKLLKKIGLLKKLGSLNKQEDELYYYYGIKAKFITNNLITRTYEEMMAERNKLQ